MNESKFSINLRSRLEPFGFEFFRIESHSTSPGCPDIHWLFAGGSATGWIETKHCTKQPKRVPYQPCQAPWLQSYSNHGGNACTLIHVSVSDKVIFVPGRESVAAWTGLDKSHGTRHISLKEGDGWKALAKLILAR